MSFNPNIVGFACNWCTYAGADLAGNLRCKYPPNTKLIRVPCSGAVATEFVLEALAKGADAVFVGGCHFGDCHYKEGNYKTDRRMKKIKEILPELGFEPQRFRLEWISGAEGYKFAEVMNEYTEQVRQLGPNPLKKRKISKGTNMITVKLDEQDIQVEENTTVAQLLEKQGKSYFRPYELPQLEAIKNSDCPLINIVEVDGRVANAKILKGLTVKEGMVINTRSKLVEEKLNERLDWLKKKDNCYLIKKLQELVVCEAENAGLISREEIEKQQIEGWTSPPSILYDPELCVRCGNCVETCKTVQTAEAIALDKEKGVILVDEAKCVRCGQCIHACPMGKETGAVKVFKETFDCETCPYSRPLGAIREIDHVKEVTNALKDPEKFVVVEFAPSIRASLGEEFGMEPGTLVTNKLYAALRRAGFDKVWDTNFTADLTIMEEGTELILRLVKAGALSKDDLPEGLTINEHTLEEVSSALPQFTSCSPGWVKFCETFYPEFIPHISSAKSPQQMLGPVAKTYAAQKLGVDPNKMVVVSIMPCTAKKYERARDEMCDASKYWMEKGKAQATFQDVDYVLTTRECGKLLKTLGIDLREMPEEEADPLIGKYTGAATIFGRTGGVMEAALRTAYELITGTPLEKLEFEDLGTLDGIKKAAIKLGDKEIKVAVAHGLSNARKVCESIKEGGEFKDYVFIEFMACPGGCIGGGGQPIPTNQTTIKARTAALNTDDKQCPLRKSHDNPEVKQIYADFLKEPVSELAHHLLHTHYIDRSGEGS